MKKITQDYLHQVFDYVDGHLIWKMKVGPRVKVGEKCGHLRKDGYVQIIFQRKVYSAHRLIWFYVYGVWPKEEVDHIDGNKSNNKIENLRDVTKSQNQQNRKKTKSNTSGWKGVFLDVRNNKWYGKITVNKKKQYLGYFATAHEAHLAYCEAAKKLHGNFANIL